MTGTIKKLVVDKGFGFILDDVGEEFFFHMSGVPGGQAVFNRLQVGDHVKFALGQAKAGKGPRAEEVTRP
jgi:cold shock CspA family protein